MPFVRPCITPGCPHRTHHTRCSVCEREHNRERNADPKRQAYKDPVYRAYRRDGVCHLCGQPGADTLDHLVPLSKGGTNDPSNLRPAHRACNSRKGNSTTT